MQALKLVARTRVHRTDSRLVACTQFSSALPAALPIEESAQGQQHHPDYDRRIREMYGATALASDSPAKPSIQEGRQQQHLPSLKEVSQTLRPASVASCASGSLSPQPEAQPDWRDLLAALKAQRAQIGHDAVLTDTFGYAYAA